MRKQSNRKASLGGGRGVGGGASDPHAGEGGRRRRGRGEGGVRREGGAGFRAEGSGGAGGGAGVAVVKHTTSLSIRHWNRIRTPDPTTELRPDPLRQFSVSIIRDVSSQNFHGKV